MSETQQPQQPPAPQPQTPAQLAQIAEFKIAIKAQVDSQYRQLTEFINGLPVDPMAKARALQHFSDGILWVAEAIRSAVLNVQPVEMPPQAKAPEAPVAASRADQIKAKKRKAKNGNK